MTMTVTNVVDVVTSVADRVTSVAVFMAYVAAFGWFLQEHVLLMLDLTIARANIVKACHLVYLH